MLSVIMLSVIMLSVILSSVIMLTANMLSIIMLSVIMLSVGLLVECHYANSNFFPATNPGLVGLPDEAEHGGVDVRDGHRPPRRRLQVAGTDRPPADGKHVRRRRQDEEHQGGKSHKTFFSLAELIQPQRVL
jgi:hypothetical protein